MGQLNSLAYRYLLSREEDAMADNLLDFLGCSPLTYELQRAIPVGDEFDHIDDEDVEKCRKEGKLSIWDAQRSVFLSFENQPWFERHYGRCGYDSSMALASITFYSRNAHGFRGYSGELPLNLKLFDDRDTLLEALGSPSFSNCHRDNSHRDYWIVGKYQIESCYRRGKVVYMRYSPPLRALLQPPQPFSGPDFGRMINCLGYPVDSPEIAALFPDNDLADYRHDIESLGEAHLNLTDGIDLYFWQDKLQKFSGFRLRRENDLNGVGYLGPLPYGINFDDTREVVLDKIGAEPARSRIDTEDGYDEWRFERIRLHILYSFLDQRVYRVTILANDPC
jgi:hypothetical protein